MKQVSKEEFFKFINKFNRIDSRMIVNQEPNLKEFNIHIREKIGHIEFGKEQKYFLEEIDIDMTKVSNRNKRMRVGANNLVTVSDHESTIKCASCGKETPNVLEKVLIFYCCFCGIQFRHGPEKWDD